MAASKSEIPEKLTSRLGRHSFFTLKHVVLSWIENSKLQIYHFQVGLSMSLHQHFHGKISSQNDEK